MIHTDGKQTIANAPRKPRVVKSHGWYAPVDAHGHIIEGPNGEQWHPYRVAAEAVAEKVAS